MNIKYVNNIKEDLFLETFKNIFENSFFITKLVVNNRPFKNKEDVVKNFMNVFDSLNKNKQIMIIKSHPDLGDRFKIKKGLTDFSQEEQAKAGLTECTDHEFSEFHNLNNIFKSKFNIPFIFSIRGKTKMEIFEEFRSRLKSNNLKQELDKSLNQVKKIAILRINEIITDE